MANDGRVDDVLGVVRARGGRVTSCRRVIVEVLCEQAQHPTAEQLTAWVQARLPDVAESTVYRFLDDLERWGVVDHVHLGHGPAVYHFVDDAHHHLVCDRCDAVVEVAPEVFEAVRRRLRKEHGFELRPRHFAVAGRCRECAAAS